MAHPDKLQIQTSFQEGVINQEPGRAPVNPKNLDNELVNIADIINAINGNLQLIQRDDGQLRDGSIGTAQLQRSVLNLVKEFNLRGAFVAGTYYAKNDGVDYNGSLWICAVPHNSTSVFVETNWLRYGAAGSEDVAVSAAQAQAAATAAAASSRTASNTLATVKNYKEQTEAVSTNVLNAAELVSALSDSVSENSNIAKTSRTRAENAALRAEAAANSGALTTPTPVSSADNAILTGVYYTSAGVPTAEQYKIDVIATDTQIIQTATSGDGVVWTRKGEDTAALVDASWSTISDTLGDVVTYNKADLMTASNLMVESGKTQQSFNSQWLDVGFKLTGNAAVDTAIVLDTIAAAKANGKGIRCAYRGTELTLNGDIDFSGIKYIDWQCDIVVPTGAIIIGGLAGGLPVDIKFRRITNGTSTITGPFPTADTFKIFGVKAGVVTVGQTNLLRIHANGGDSARNSNGYFTLNLHGHVRAFRVSDEGVDGWNNNITVLGGRIVDLDVTGTGYVPNELTFDYNTFEGPEVKIRFKKAWSNKVQNARFENTSAAPGIIFESDSMQNTVVQRWSGSGSTRGQFTFSPPVADSGVGNMCTTQSLTEFDAVEIFNLSASSGLIGNSVGIDCLAASVGSNSHLTPASGGVRIDLNSNTINIKSANIPIVVSDVIEVKNGDAIVIEAEYTGSLFRPIVYVYDANKNRIPTLSSDAVLIPGATYNVETGSFSTGANLSAAAMRTGFSINSPLIKYVKIGVFNTATNAAFKSIAARLFIQKLSRSSSRSPVKPMSNLILNGLVEFSDVPAGTTYINSATNIAYYCASRIETNLTADATASSVITVQANHGIEVGAIVGINVASSAILKWVTVNAVSGNQITVSDVVSATNGARVVGNLWKPIA